jgi:tetrahydromethanopterin S-methyltransferase subunit G
MTDRERVDLKDYMKERFDAIEQRFDDLDKRLHPLEQEFSERRGRRALAVVVGKVIAVISAFIAAVAALFGLGPN